jgi:ATP-binding cassette subfamily F protein uup
MAEGNGRWVEYAGGYSDMLAQRGEGLVAAKAAREAPQRSAPAPQTPNPSVKRKLSFKEKHALETLPDKIVALEDEIAGLEARLADSNFFARDPAVFEATAKRLNTARNELSASEDEWLRLEILSQELGAA